MKGHPDVEIYDNVVVKRYQLDYSIELEKALRMYELFGNYSEIVPRVISNDLSERTITYERIMNIKNLREYYIETMTSDAIDDNELCYFYNIGRSLGVIHNNLKLSSQGSWLATKNVEYCVRELTSVSVEEYLKGTPEGFLHCDFGFANVHYVVGEEFPIPVILDPSSNNYSSTLSNNYTSIYVDIGVLFSNLNGRIPLAKYPFCKWNRLQLIKNSFCDGYKNVTAYDIDQSIAEVLGYSFSYSNFRSRYSKLRSLLQMKILYNDYKGNRLNEL